jgi:ABC-type glutathione transport system ATPase component
MVKRTRKRQKTHSRLQELVVVATADTAEEAKECEKLLKNNDIPAMVKQQQDEFSEGKRFAVIAPEEMADEAHVIIESQDAYDDFYDSGLDDENEEDPEDDLFEDEF